MSRKGRFFDSFSDQDLDRLLKHCTLTKYSQGQVVLRQGELDDHEVYLIIVGGVAVEVASGGERVFLTHLRNGDIFGEFSMFSGEARSATVVTMEDSEILHIDIRQIDSLFEEFPRLAYDLIKHIADEACRKLSDLSRLRTSG